MDATSTTSAQRLRASDVALVRHVLRHLLSGDGQQISVPSGREHAFMRAVLRHRLAAYFSMNLDQIETSTELRGRIAASGAMERAACLGMARDLGFVLESLNDAGVRCLTFKGLALAKQAYGDFAARGSGDLDLLVDPRDVETAREILMGIGWKPDHAYPGPSSQIAWNRMVKTYYELPMNSNRTSIDLHWRLSASRAALPSFDVLWSRSNTVEIGPFEIRTLEASDALRQSSNHAAKDDWSWLRSLSDVIKLEEIAGESVDPRGGPRAERLSRAIAADMLQQRPRFQSHGAAPRWALRRASKFQSLPPNPTVGAFPGYAPALNLRRHLRGAHDARDAIHAVSIALLPAWDTGGGVGGTTSEVLTRSTIRRFRRIVPRFKEWARQHQR